MEYTDYEDERNSGSWTGGFEEDGNGNGTMAFDNGERQKFQVELESDPTSLTLLLDDGTELTLYDYEWSMQNAG